MVCNLSDLLDSVFVHGRFLLFSVWRGRSLVPVESFVVGRGALVADKCIFRYVVAAVVFLFYACRVPVIARAAV